MKLTKTMVYAAARDAGNASMRKGGRTVWAVKDYNAACAEFSRLIKFVEQA